MRYGFSLQPWTGIFGTYSTSWGPVIPHVGVWFWADFPERRPYLRRVVEK
jgi:hypothetical protein